MITSTQYTASIDNIEEAAHLLTEAGKHDLTERSGDFFYDPWLIKHEFRGTVWESILQTLPFDIGQARVIILESGKCYYQHADIDDRYHLNLTGKDAYLVDIEDQNMYKCENDGIWYEMDAGKIHSAVNFGVRSRAQLVVRKLLYHHYIKDTSRIKLSLKDPIPFDARFWFDNYWSTKLNKWSKTGLLDNFKKVNERDIEFDIPYSYKKTFENIVNQSPLKVEWHEI